ncbi:MFS multidrug transporter [Phlyctema vagabunda]|uniref:MFS multidrug transporter n=1 Tax=Phlyctema vagabunda TaxID=108571 RepID=A0ABR4P887_9HELO
MNSCDTTNNEPRGSEKEEHQANPRCSPILNSGNVQVSRSAISSSHIVDFDTNDDLTRPLNWPMRKKVVTTLLYGLTTAGSTWASSIFSTVTADVRKEFAVSSEVSTLGVSLFLFGFGVGPLFWAPISEAYGRRIAVFLPYFIAAIFCFGTAAAKDIQTIIITRFFVGFFRVMRDIWSDSQRGVAVLFYSLTLVGGPLFSPIGGAAIVQSPLGWRWTHYITGTMMLVILFVDILVLDETYAKVILVKKAEKLRRETGNWALHAKHEEDINLHDLFHKFLFKPIQLLQTPICFFMVLYSSFVYGIVYLNFASYQIEYIEIRKWSPIEAALPFLAVFLGIILGAIMCFHNQSFYIKRLVANNEKPVPEARLPPMMLGGVFLACGLFIFAWTSGPRTHWIAGCVGGVLMGMGFFSIFQGSTNYLVDTFNEYGASAIAANTLIRNAFAGAFPLFTKQMFHSLGVSWAVSLLGKHAEMQEEIRGLKQELAKYQSQNVSALNGQQTVQAEVCSISPMDDTQVSEQFLGEINVPGEKLAILYEHFFRYYHPLCPLLDPSLSCDEYFNLSPLLAWTIVVVAARRYPQDPLLLAKLSSSYKKLLWATVAEMPQRYHSVKALALLCTWPIPLVMDMSRRSKTERLGAGLGLSEMDPTFMFSGIMMQIALQTGLHRALHAQDFIRQTREVSESEVNDRKLTWAVCNIISQAVSSGNGQPSTTIYDWNLGPGLQAGWDTLSGEIEQRLKIEKFSAKVTRTLYSNSMDLVGLIDENEQDSAMAMLTIDLEELERSFTANLSGMKCHPTF